MIWNILYTSSFVLKVAFLFKMKNLHKISVSDAYKSVDVGAWSLSSTMSSKLLYFCSKNLKSKNKRPVLNICGLLLLRCYIVTYLQEHVSSITIALQNLCQILSLVWYPWETLLSSVNFEALILKLFLEAFFFRILEYIKSVYLAKIWKRKKIGHGKG